MKDSGVCTKCGASEVVRVSGEKISVVVPRPNMIPVGRLGGVVVSRFICWACGYSEEWVESPDALQKLKNHYETLPQSVPSNVATNGGGES